jgi:hypothetical protein
MELDESIEPRLPMWNKKLMNSNLLKKVVTEPSAVETVVVPNP